MTKRAFICADWGTTSLRLWALRQDGTVVAEEQSPHGMSMLDKDGYAPVLEQFAEAHGLGPEVPSVVCGMAGAAQGWVEAAYVDVPTELSGLHRHAVRVPSVMRDTRILPGLAKRDASAPDVIRGEETILMGAAKRIGAHGMVCLPGTHSKWVEIKDGVIRDFRTWMTGELFSLLSCRSTLRHFISDIGEVADDGSSFRNAVVEALERPQDVLSKLFSVRSMPLLLGAETIPEMPARLSGLLIGLEIAGAKEAFDGPVQLIASGVLAARYEAAFGAAGLAVHRIDAQQAVRQGLLSAALELWPN